MASYSYHSSFFLLFFLLVITTAPLEAYARNTQFFSKVSRTDPQASDPKFETRNLTPSASTPVFTKAADERGYGLFSTGETYKYPPTTTNPTKSKPAKLNKGEVVESDEGHESFFQGERSETGEKQGRVYGTTGEKQGMSDTRFLENGKLFQGERSETGEKQGSVYGTTAQKQGSVYGTTVQKQGMSDTRFLENGKYFYDNEAEKMSNNNGYSNSYKYRNEEEEEEEEEGGDKYGSELYGTEEEQGRQGNNRVYGKQGMSDTRFLENGKYFYDIEAEKKNNVAFYDRNSKYEGEGSNGEELFYDTGKSNEYYRKERYAPEDTKYSVKGGELKNYAPNKFPRYEFDSMEEYEKYEEGRSHQNEYAP